MNCLPFRESKCQDLGEQSARALRDIVTGQVVAATAFFNAALGHEVVTTKDVSPVTAAATAASGVIKIICLSRRDGV